MEAAIHSDAKSQRWKAFPPPLPELCAVARSSIHNPVAYTGGPAPSLIGRSSNPAGIAATQMIESVQNAST